MSRHTHAVAHAHCAGCQYMVDGKCTVPDWTKCPVINAKRITLRFDSLIKERTDNEHVEAVTMAAILHAAAHDAAMPDNPQFGRTATTKASARAFLLSDDATGAAALAGINPLWWDRAAGNYIEAIETARKWGAK